MHTQKKVMPGVDHAATRNSKPCSLALAQHWTRSACRNATWTQILFAIRRATSPSTTVTTFTTAATTSTTSTTSNTTALPLSTVSSSPSFASSEVASPSDGAVFVSCESAVVTADLVQYLRLNGVDAQAFAPPAVTSRRKNGEGGDNAAAVAEAEAEAVAQSDVVEWLFLSKARRIIYAGQVSRTKSVSDHPRGQRSACLPACLPASWVLCCCMHHTTHSGTTIPPALGSTYD